MTDIRQLLLNPRKRVKLDNEDTSCTSAEVEAVQVQRPSTAQASGLAAPADNDDDLPHDVIERHDNDNDTAQRVS